MEPLDRVLAGLKNLGDRLDEPRLEPNPDRTDWSAHHEEITSLKQEIDSEILTPLSGALAALDDPEQRDQLSEAAALTVADYAALLHASGVRSDVKGHLSTAVSLLPSGPLKQQLQAAHTDLDNFVWLTLGRGYFRQGKYGRADGCFRRVLKASTAEALKQGATSWLEVPRPIKKAPALFRINGFGFGMYGRRDRWDDGTHVATWCLSALWLPILPIRAYRVFDHGDGSFTFFAKQRLSGFARAFQAIVLAGVVLGGGALAAESYLNSPERLSRLALVEAKAAGPEEAAARYERLLSTWAYSGAPDVLDEAAEALLRHYASKVPSPLSPRDVDQAERVLRRVATLPAGVPRDRAGTFVAGELQRWVSELGDDTTEGARASARLLTVGEDAVPVAHRDPLRVRRKGVQASLAARLAGEWPLEALRLYAGNGDEGASLGAAEALLKDLEAHPALVVAAAAVVEDERNKTLKARMAPALAKATAALAHEGRDALLSGKDPRALRRRLKEVPGDQEVALALAELSLGKGALDEAIRLLEGFGGPGWLIPSAQQVLASLYLDAGKLEDAERILDPYLAAQLPAFTRARQRYIDEMNAARERLISRAERGALPSDLTAQLQGASEEKQGQIFGEWLSKQLEADPKLASLRAAYEGHADVVSAALTLGRVKLLRADQVSGDERKTLLDEAERAFLAIRAEAEGLPAYHLSLGQVYHRLGRVEDGERELQGLLERGDPALSVAVARTYRALGLVGRAREVASDVWKGGDATSKSEAAVLLALMASDLEEEERWLERADASDPFVKTSLLNVKAQRLLRDGRYAEADRAFAEVAAAYGRDAAHSSAAANNAALANQARYSCTGDLRHLAKAREGLEAALRLEPDSALVVDNLAGHARYEGTLRVLDGWIRARSLPLDGESSGVLLASLVEGPLKERARAALREHPLLRRSHDLGRQTEVLAPGRASPYASELLRYRLLDDTAGLRDLHARLSRGGNIETTQTDEGRARYRSGADDEKILAGYAAMLTRLDGIEKALATGDDRTTQAAARRTRAHYLRQRAELTGDPADADAAVAALRDAHRLWPELGADRDLVWFLVDAALLHAARSSDAVRALRESEHRIYTTSLLLHRAASRPDADAVLGALRREPAFLEAVKLRKQGSFERPTLGDWLLARAAGDADMEKRASAAFAREDERLRHEIGAMLDPGSESAKLALELVSAHR